MGDAAAESSDGALPSDGVLVHVGPHKTGTTAIQASLFAARKRMARHGAHLAYDERHPRSAIVEGTNTRALRGSPSTGKTTWSDVTGAVAAHPDARVVMSSEIFSNTKPARIPDMIDELGGARVHVVLTVRPLARILPSQWQQYLSNRRTMPYDAWLEAVFNEPDGRIARRFWRRHAHDRAVDRWLPALGADRLCVVAVDQTRPKQLLRAFEQLLGLPDGTLPSPRKSNPSMTVGAAEVVRLINAEARRRGWSHEHYAAVVRHSLVERLKARPLGPEDRPITTPAWALDAATRRQTEAFTHIESTGVRVIGDLRALLQEEAAAGTRVAEEDPLEAACDLLQGMARRDTPGSGLDSVSTRRLLQIVRDRALRSVRRSTLDR